MFNVGDIVYLKSGGPAMTVISDDGKQTTVQWFNGSAPQSTAFPDATLVTDDPAPVLQQALIVANAQAAVDNPVPVKVSQAQPAIGG